MYKNFIFDLYGTLIDLKTDENQKELWAKLSLFFSYNGAKYSSIELKSSYIKEVKCALGENKTTNYPDIKIINVFKLLYAHKSVNASTELLVETTRLFRILSTKYIKLYPGVKDVIKLLKISEKKIFLLSNGQRDFSEPELKYLGIFDYFDGIYCSADYGICKPDVNFYKIIVENEKLNINESVMIGNDHTTDIKGANDIKMDCVYIHTNQSQKKNNGFDCNLKILDGDFLKIKELIS